MPIQTSINNTVGAIFSLIATSGEAFKLQFVNAFTSFLEWNPTAARSIAFPDQSGTVLLEESAINASSGAADAGKIIKTNAAGTIDATLFTNVGVRAFHNASQSIANGTSTALLLNSERYDTQGLHSVTTNTNRLTALIEGVYLIGASVRFVANTTGIRTLAIRLNGANVIAAQHLHTPTTETHLSVTTLYRLSVDDYVEMVVHQTSGGSLSVMRLADSSPEACMQLLS